MELPPTGLGHRPLGSKLIRDAFPPSGSAKSTTIMTTRVQRILGQLAPQTDLSAPVHVSSFLTAAASASASSDPSWNPPVKKAVATADLCDEHPNDVSMLPFQFKSYGQSVKDGRMENPQDGERTITI
jgi:hypothetical protein